MATALLAAAQSRCNTSASRKIAGVSLMAAARPIPMPLHRRGTANRSTTTRNIKKNSIWTKHNPLRAGSSTSNAARAHVNELSHPHAGSLPFLRRMMKMMHVSRAMSIPQRIHFVTMNGIHDTVEKTASANGG